MDRLEYFRMESEMLFGRTSRYEPVMHTKDPDKWNDRYIKYDPETRTLWVGEGCTLIGWLDYLPYKVRRIKGQGYIDVRTTRKLTVSGHVSGYVKSDAKVKVRGKSTVKVTVPLTRPEG